MKSNTEWNYWGEKDPLFGVAAWEGKQKEGPDPWTDKEFYRLGELDWADFERHWRGYGLTAGRCLEIGCGAGRLTRAMAGTFEHLDALDISSAMLDYAQQKAARSNVRYHKIDGSEIPLADRQIDAAFSTHVFQHFDVRNDAEKYFMEIARVLKPGGTKMIHLPLHSWPAGTGVVTRWTHCVKKRAQGLKAVLKRQLIKFGFNARLMRFNSYDIDWLYQVLLQLGFEDIELVIFVTRSNNEPHSFVLATRPARSCS